MAMKRRTHRRGLSLPEVLLCATISALLLTACGVAFKASFASYRAHQERQSLMAIGRTTLARLARDIRASDLHGPINTANQATVSSQFAAGTMTDTPGIQMIKQTADADDPSVNAAVSTTWVLYTYQFSAATHTITLTRTVNGVSTTVTLAPCVSDFHVYMTPTRSATNVLTGNPTYDILLRATLSITLTNRDGSNNKVIQDGDGVESERFIEAAMPRKTFTGL